MDFEINLKNLLFYSYHGVMEEERIIGNEYKVNLAVFLHINSDFEKDDLDLTISYVKLFEIVKEEMGKPRKLLETVAYSIAKRIISNFEIVTGGRIEIEKMHPPIPSMLGSASVSLNF